MRIHSTLQLNPSTDLITSAGGLVATTSLTSGDLTSGRLPLISTAGLLTDDALITYSVTRDLNGYNYMAVSSSVSGSTYIGDGLVWVAGTGDSDIFMANSSEIELSVHTVINSGVSYKGLVYEEGDVELDENHTYVICSGSSGDQSVNLPVSPQPGQWFSVKRSHNWSAGYNLTITTGSSPGGKQIEGEDSIELETAGAAVTLVFDNNTNTWMIF